MSFQGFDPSKGRFKPKYTLSFLDFDVNIFGFFPKCGPEIDLGWPPLL
jgi:hypothetical protein